jgi:penicillin-binding protein 1B
MILRLGRTWLAVAAALVLSMLCAIVLVSIYSTVELQRFERTETQRGVFLYAAGQRLAPGVNVRAVDLAGTLARLGYVERGDLAGPGQFRRASGVWDILLRDERASVRLELADHRITRVVKNGTPVPAATLEGEVLAGGGDTSAEEYRPIRVTDAPMHLINAVLTVEDQRFFEHSGVDLRGLARAAWANIRAGRVAEGGSTLTQQLVKNRLLTPERTLTRKLREAWLATVIEWRYSKWQILEAYLNEVYLGQRGPRAIRGMGAAARVYFGKEVHQLTAGESALLAGMVRAPNTYSPAVDPGRARARRDVVLARMRDSGALDAAAYERARREPVRAQTRPRSGQPAPYFTDHVRRVVEEHFDDGARIVTTLDLALQRFAENAVARGLDELESRHPSLRRSDSRSRLQAALVALDPATGEIRAFVGGREYQASQFDRVTLARRQPGSAFKPFVYLAALRPRDGALPFTAATMVDDSPITVVVNAKPWSPRNYEDRYEGRVTLRRAMEQSLNGATVRIAQMVGAPAIVDTARDFGLGEEAIAVPALALGALEVTPLQLASAYVPLANPGVAPSAAHAVREVHLENGKVVTPATAQPPGVVISPAEAYLMTSLLRGVIRSGTGSPTQKLGLRGDFAGKSGTTNDGRDAWFVGYSSRLVAAVWVGFDDGTPHGLSGSIAALPIWTQFMKQAVEAYPAPEFTMPDGITVASIDGTNGMLADEHCPLIAREVFLTGTEPAKCDEHSGLAPRIDHWWNRFRQWFQR